MRIIIYMWGLILFHQVSIFNDIKLMAIGVPGKVSAGALYGSEQTFIADKRVIFLETATIQVFACSASRSAFFIRSTLRPGAAKARYDDAVTYCHG
ncbi:hypothetical protein [Pseudomonas cichorii]|uniref:hypothetical protein n=1 Tax=Pseudomonas cichorii TaxID=36746 RepID=UPI0011C4545E|nr:hypothetical protein [Pseudomonas cichorii]